MKSFLLLLAIAFIAIANAAKSAKFIPGRFTVEFPLDTADVKKTGDDFMAHLHEVFPEVSFSIPRAFNHKFLKAITIQIDSGVTQRLHDKVYRFATDNWLTDVVHPVHLLARPQAVSTVGTPAPSTQIVPNARRLLPHDLTQVDRIHREFQNYGQGVVVGIIDSGIDYMHPALGGGFGEGYKVRYGRDLVGDNYGETGIPVPDNDPMDACGQDMGLSGHGTHVAGIIAGHNSENFTGVAPGATLGMWRVFGCTGGASDDIVIEAMLDAYDAGVDIISMSLGFFSGWEEYPTSIIASRIYAAGVPVITSAGNLGNKGVYSTSAPSTGEGVISVASVDNTHTLMDYIKVEGMKELLEFKVGYKDPGDSNYIPDGLLVLGAGTVDGKHDACDPTKISLKVRGSLAIVERGECTYNRQVINLQSAGAIGVILFPNSTIHDTIGVARVPNATIPVISVSHRSGVSILQAITLAGSTGVKVTNVRSVEPYITGLAVSEFSSIGPTFESKLKPTLAGFGGQVYSTVPTYMGSWTVLSGTSMAAPYVAGTYALYYKAMRDGNANHSLTYIQEKFQNYAFKSSSLSSHVRNGTIDSPAHQGGGLVQVYDALYQTVHVSPGSISFNDTAHLQKSHKLTIVNHGESTASYCLVNKVSVSIAPFNASDGYAVAAPPVYGDEYAKLRFSRRTVTIAPGQSVEVTVSVMPPKSDPNLHTIYGGYVEFKSKTNDHKDITVPYIGLAGNQRDIPIFSTKSPLLMNYDLTLYYNETDIFEYQLSDNSTEPQVVMFLNIGTRILTSSLQDDSGNEIGLYPLASEEHYVDRTTQDNPSIYYWDGIYLPHNVKDEDANYVQVKPGRYRFVVRALRLFGNINNPNDWDSWRSPVIQVTA